MDRVRLTVVAVACAAAALVLAPAARVNHLPGCLFAGGRDFKGASFEPRLRLRVATIPKTLERGDTPIWVLTTINRSSRARRVGFRNSAYAEIQLWRNGRRMYSWYEAAIHQQALWGRVIPARSSWSCVQAADDPLELEPGRYTLVAVVLTHGQRPRARRAIMLG